MCRSKGGNILGTTGRVASQGYYCTHWGSMNTLVYLPIREGLEAFYGICIGTVTIPARPIDPMDYVEGRLLLNTFLGYGFNLFRLNGWGFLLILPEFQDKDLWGITG